MDAATPASFSTAIDADLKQCTDRIKAMIGGLVG
jgi:hypothetical protein